jgi:ribonuclease P protein component
LEFSGEQADLPAEQPSAGEDARVPAADAHPCGSRHPLLASGQGPHATVGLIAARSVLPAAARMRRRADFTATTRGGRRAATPALVLSLRMGQSAAAPDSPLVGFIVGRAVGPAVVRNQVRRRLRHLVRERLGGLPAGAGLVIRAKPVAAATGFDELGVQLDRALASVRRPRP